MDISESALEISKKLILKLGLENKFHFISGDAQNIQTEKKYDVVIGASLIFENDFQQQILENIYKNISCNYFLVRSSNGIRQLMYKKVEKKFLNKYFQILLEIHPKNELVNSIIITKKYA
jgi:2-polyprenyl-3-methyl-5-hydroxy-6-metoxy-1,4-benzoquinol methylase